MNASDAPPPVERKSTWSAQASSSRALALSPPPTTENPAQSATAWATTRVPGGEPLVLEGAQRPVPQDRAGVTNDFGEGGGRFGADVEPGPAVGQIVLDHLDARPEVRPRLRARRCRPARGPGCRSAGRMSSPGVEEGPAVLNVVHVEQGAPDVAGPGRPGR